MSSYGISHVEFYVGDAKQAAYYYREAFGFRPVAQAGPETGLAERRSVLLEQGVIRLLLTSPLTADSPVTAYVTRHGDGVKDIALRVPDVEGAFELAVSQGAAAVVEPYVEEQPDGRAVVATVAAFGDVVHSFVQHENDGQLPGRHLRSIGQCPDEPPEPCLRDVDHVAVCLPPGELDKTVTFYQQALGFDEAFEERVEFGDQAMESKVVRSKSGGVTLTLLEPDPRRKPGQIDGFLRAHGNAGVQHLAFGTPDIHAAVRAFTTQGVEFLTTPDRYYDALESRIGSLGGDLARLRESNVLADRDAWGLLFQIFTRSPHARGTFFLELIERRGAKTFGSGNIKGLYQAVERDQTGVSAADAL